MNGFVAVLGGTFDPVHVGHLHVVRCVRSVFLPERFLLVPCATSPHKTGRRVAAVAHRLAMLRLAVRDLPGVEISTVEIDRGGVSFTIETLRTLREGPPAARPVFVVGEDALAEIDTWREQASLLREFDLIAVHRPDAPALPAVPAGASIVEVPFAAGAGRRIDGPPPGSGGRIFRVPIPPSPISSSEVRRRAARAEATDGLVPREVAVYIRGHGLYREEVSS